jgi:hypothetical protein
MTPVAATENYFVSPTVNTSVDRLSMPTCRLFTSKNRTVKSEGKVETAFGRMAYNFDNMPLWQFVSLAIGTAVAGDVNLKLMHALIGQRNSGKGMLMTAVGAAFRGLVDTGKSANNLLGNSSDNDEAKNFMWMTKAANSGARLV